MIDVLRESGLRGRGGAGFPTWRKWEAVRAGYDPIVVINASEGEPLSAKDRTLLATEPDLVLDGALLAAESVGASEVVLYGHPDRRAARAAKKRRIAIVRPKHGYVAGESSAVAQRVSGGRSLPRSSPPHVSEQGAFGRPTLVHNAETLAIVARIARHGAAWYRSRPTAMMTIAGNVRRPGVYEVDLGLSAAGALELAGGPVSEPPGALLGGYFGTWHTFESLRETPLDGPSFGCGVLAVLPDDACGIVESARILSYLAGETAGQCGPCVYGLRALSETFHRVAVSKAAVTDLDRLRRWAAMVKGRGACHHPDGAVQQLASALDAFAPHVEEHLRGVPCPGLRSQGFPRPPGVRW